MACFKIENLTFSYPNGKQALRGIELEIKDGEFVTVCGKSGCGKTTLLRLLKPLAAPHGNAGGKIYFNDKPIDELTDREQCIKIGYVMQNPDNQIVTDKVWHELAFGCENLGMKSSEIRARAGEMAAFFGLEDIFYSNTHSLSGGQKQLLNLAAVMMLRPSVLILDEPTAQLDPSAAYSFLQMLKRINLEMGVTVVLSEHRTEEFFPLSDRIIVIEDGRIAADAPPELVGGILKETGTAAALPAAAKIGLALSDEKILPITISGGRKFLSDYAKTHKPKEIKQRHYKPNAEKIIEMKDVRLRYDKDLPDVLCGVSLSVSKGEILALIGGNGAGKSTVLSVLAGNIKPYAGKVKIFSENRKVIGMLPQNPQDLFTRKTVREELESVDKQNAEETAKLCGVFELYEQNPYDLSGGEQQRAAIAKLLLLKPEILLLDEPAKGMDEAARKNLGKILTGLSHSGVTIVTVTHDVEFAARFADRCIMMFDGVAAAEGTADVFFKDRYFYTTAACRIADGILPGAVLTEDIISAFGGTDYETDNSYKDINAVSVNKQNTLENVIEYNVKKSDKTLSLRSRIAALMGFAAIPLTVLFGKYMLSDRKYYFISLLIILEAMFPFVFMFEKRRPKAREAVLISVLCAVGVAGRGAFYMLPQFKPVAAVTVISGACLGGGAGFLVGAVTAFISNFFFGQGIWTPWQMLAFGMVGLVSGIIFEKGLLPKKRIPMSIFGGFAAVIIYGGIINPASVLMMTDKPTPAMIISAYAAGLPFDLVQGAATVFFLWLCAEPFVEKIERIKIKYGLAE